MKLSNQLKFLCITLLYGFGILNSQTVSLAQPQALKATTGEGLHKNKIWWINWDINNNLQSGDNLTNGVVSTFVSPAGFIYTITLSNIKIFTSSGVEVISGTNKVFNSAKSDSYFLNNFPFGYGGFPLAGTPSAQQNVISLSNLGSFGGGGNRVTFRVTVQARDPTGIVGNSSGIVIGGTESLGSQSEWYTLTTPSGKVRLIDKYIYDNNWADFDIKLHTSNVGKTIKASRNTTISGDAKGDVMLFAEDVPFVDIEVKGGGGQHIAVGFLEELDYSDAPSSYGNAYHTFENKFSGGIFSDGDIIINKFTSNKQDAAASNGQISKISIPTLRLGAEIDSEEQPTLPIVGSEPNTDDNKNIDDEDALPNTTVGVNGYFAIPYVNISPLVSYLTMWIDKNRNGVFDDNEKIQKVIPPNKTGKAIMDITNLTIPIGNNYYTRLRYSSKANLHPTGYAPDGEVEDHFINIVNNQFNILGNVYLDSDSNIPNGDPYYQVNVELYNAAGTTLLQSAQTNYDGAYIFSGLSSGNYVVKVVLPTSPSLQHVSSTDATPLNGLTIVNVNNNNSLNNNFGVYFSLCYKNANTSTVGNLPTTLGVTSLGRAGKESGNWPMVRNGGWIALESKTKGFVLNRVAANYNLPLDNGQIPIVTNPVKGMLVYDTTNNCLKFYDGVSWKCISEQTCPTVN